MLVVLHEEFKNFQQELFLHLVVPTGTSLFKFGQTSLCHPVMTQGNFRGLGLSEQYRAGNWVCLKFKTVEKHSELVIQGVST